MYTTGTRHHQTQGAHGDGKHVSTPVRAISTKMWEQYTKKLPDDHRASRSDSAGLTALATIPKLRKARTISPEKATSGTRKVSAQLAQTRAAEARIMDACTARGIFPQRSRQPGAEDASMMPSTKSPNI